MIYRLRLRGVLFLFILRLLKILSFSFDALGRLIYRLRLRGFFILFTFS